MVSIIIPFYNSEEFLEICMESVKNQTYKDFEVILVDDGSTDISGSVADDFAKEDARFKVIHLDNGGVSRARNEGMRVAKGEYVTFVDSDDYLSSNHIENLVSKMPKSEGICICNYKLIYQNKTLQEIGINSYKTGSIDKKEVVRNLCEVFGGYPWNKMFDLQFIKKEKILFNEEIKICEDLLFVLEYILKSKGDIYYVETPTYMYLQRAFSAVRSLKAEDTVTSLIARKKCVDMLNSEMPEVIDGWKRLAIFTCFPLKRQYLTNHVDRELYEDIVNEIIDDMYDDVFQKSNYKDKIKLFIYKHCIGGVILYKKILKL